MLYEDEHQDTSTPSERIEHIAAAVVLALRDRILELSPESMDEDAWIHTLAGSADDERRPSFDSAADLLTVFAEHDSSLLLGELPLRAEWAHEAAGYLGLAHTDPGSMYTVDVARFADVLAKLLESIGLETSADEVRGPAQTRPEHAAPAASAGPAESAAEEPVTGNHRLETRLDSLDISLTVHSAYSARLASGGLSPIIGISLHNTSAEPVTVSTLEAVFAGHPEREHVWQGPEIEVPAGDSLHLDRSELTWLPPVPESPDGLTADELLIVLGADGRSRELSTPVSWVPVGTWTPAAPAELAVDFVHTSDPAITALAERLPAPDDDAEPQPAVEVLAAVAALVDADLTTAPDAGSPLDTPVTFRTPTEIRDSGTATASERALLIAAVLEYLDVPVALIGTTTGLRAGAGHTFDGEETRALHREAAIAAELSAMTTAGTSGTEELDDVVFIVDVTAARQLIGAAGIVGASAQSATQAGAGADATSVGASASEAGDRDEAEPRALRRWKRELLDLSFSSPLLGLPATAGAELQIAPEALPEFADLLAASTDFSVQPVQRMRAPVDKYRLGGGSHSSHESSSLRSGELVALPYRGSFDARMKQLAHDSRRTLQENGYPSLYITLGTLEWTDNRGATGRSPLLLAPVAMTGTAREGYSIRLEAGGELQPNQSLLEKLQLETSAELPSLFTPPTIDGRIDVAATFSQLQQELRAAGIKGRLHQTARLLILSYATLPQWRDLNENWRRLLSTPVAGHLARRPFARFTDPVPPAALNSHTELDTWLPSRADSTQLEAVAAASAGNSFVLEGPPGTGKSQTITNMIADGMARGRRILFVAEKQAALDVVLGRLKSFGLDALVLDAHGEHQTGNAIRQQLQRALEVSASEGSAELSAARKELAEAVEQLRTYPHALHAAPGAANGGANADSDVWSLFQTCLEQESEHSANAEWQPEAIDVDRLFAQAGSEGPDSDALADLAKRIRRLRRRAEGDVSTPAEDESPDAQPLRDVLRELGQAGLVRTAAEISRGRSADKLAEAIRLAIAREQLRRATTAAGLQHFTGTERGAAVRRYVKLADRVAELTRTALAGVIAGRRTWRGGAAQPPEEFTAALGQPGAGAHGETNPGSQQDRSIRELFTAFGEDIVATTPCVLMSPAGVSKHLPVDGPGFDTVIFDEASQITTASAIGAVGRAQAAVIVGDSQQMPPSAEFTSDLGEDLPQVVGAEDSAEAALAAKEAGASRLESVLSAAVNAGFDRKWLAWHYRSRSEELIAFSNRKHYQGRLSSFPTPPVAERTFPIDLRFIGGEYAKVKGGQKANQDEAEAVVAEVSARLARAPEKSIAVVTFNASQRSLIANALEASEDPHIQAALTQEHEPLMVKNVDNVQGDERDVVLFSIAYAPDKKTGRLNQSFGPVNRPGGERRFNVAITRAREEIVIFTSLRSSDLDLRSSRSKGLQDLRDYLADAERGAVVRRQAVTDRSSFYREAIAQRLRERGLNVEVGVGTSAFVVDLAVEVRAGATEGGDGWLAVLLDPPSWAARPTVWDRDGLPLTVLEGSMGWTHTERVLLADWLADPEAVVERIVELVGGSGSATSTNAADS